MQGFGSCLGEDSLRRVSAWINIKVKANEKARVYILAIMSDVLAKKHESLATAKEIMDALKAMFGQPEWSLRHEAIKYICTKRMKEGTSVREHVLDMMMHLNIAEVNGGVIDEANQTLTMGKEKQVEANVGTTKRKFSRGSSSKNKDGPSKPKPQIKKKEKGRTPKQNKGKKAAEKGKCYHCSQKGHWLRNCPKYLAKKKAEKEMQGKYDLLVVETCLVEYENSTWILDLGATGHICFSFQENSSWKRLSEGEITLKVGTEEMVSAEAVGDLKLYFGNRYVILKNVLYDHVYLIHHKSDSFEKFKEYKAEVENELGYPKESRGGLFYDLQENKVFVSTNATILKEDHIRNHQPQSKLVLNEISKSAIDKPSSSTKVIDKTKISGQTHPSQELREPRRSGRVVHQPDRYLDHDQWIKAMDLEMESMYFNSVWTLVDQPNDVKSIGYKWIYKRKRDQGGKVQTFKARLVAKGYNQREGVDYEETFSPIAMLKSIRILLSIATFYDYEIWHKDVKTTFLNGNLEESIYMTQPEGFIKKGQEQKNSKKGLLSYRYGIHLSKEQCPKTPQEVKDLRKIPYASAVGSLMYAMLCTRPDICFSVRMVSRYQANPGHDHWTTVKNILKYLKRTKDYMLVYGTKDLILTGYIDSDFQTDKDTTRNLAINVTWRPTSLRALLKTFNVGWALISVYNEIKDIYKPTLKTSNVGYKPTSLKVLLKAFNVNSSLMSVDSRH
ncbi:gag/pol protein [Cucumis melo var. makuwa]|uniref:Gag/pol protein n=1 Tax=Cucumis melo var. makuwa TaxID=1194695 RepID=A0A5A7UL81_CUCMM|nr:gag/pol protein [Cucumis melo var. makuwa]